MAGVVVFSACDKDKDDAAADGRTYAKALCECAKVFDAATKDLDHRNEKDWDALEVAQTAMEECADKAAVPYQKKYGEIDEDHPFFVAFIEELGKCPANVDF